MFESLDQLLAATALFVGGHFLLSSEALRQPLAARLGEQVFRLVYALVIAVAFVWMLVAYKAAPYITLWTTDPALFWIPVLVMPVALLLAVCGLTTPGPTMVGGERYADPGPGVDPAPGILRVTRHPFLWGTALWAAAHLVVNGDVATLVLTVGMLALSLGGMRHIDRRREASLGSAWGPVALTTSVVPFAAILSKRTAMDWAGIGWWRPLLALALYVALLLLHETMIGVGALP